MSVKRSGGTAPGLSARKSTTVSTTEPVSPYEGDVWVNPSAAAAAPSLAIDYTTLTDTAVPGTANVWGQWGTEEVRFTQFDGRTVWVKADVSGYIQGWTGTNSGRYVQIQVSFDDGSTWSTSTSPFGKITSGGNTFTRTHVAMTYAVSGTVDTAIQVRARIMRDTTTDASTYKAGAIAVVVAA